MRSADRHHAGTHFGLPLSLVGVHEVLVRASDVALDNYEQRMQEGLSDMRRQFTTCSRCARVLPADFDVRVPSPPSGGPGEAPYGRLPMKLKSFGPVSARSCGGRKLYHTGSTIEPPRVRVNTPLELDDPGNKSSTGLGPKYLGKCQIEKPISALVGISRSRVKVD